MIRKGFFKVYQTNDEGGITLAEFFNPETKEEYSQCVRNLWIFEHNDKEAYNAPINAEAFEAWRAHRRDFRVGDRVVVFRGKKLPIGLMSTIVDMYDWKDAKGIIRTRYAVLSNGQRTSVWNLRIL